MKEEVCENCGGKISPDKVTVKRWYSGKPYIIEDVPVGICQFCGERYYEADTIDKLDVIAQESKEGKVSFAAKGPYSQNKEEKGHTLKRGSEYTDARSGLTATALSTDELVEDLYAELSGRFDLEDSDEDIFALICKAEYLCKKTDIPKELETAVSFYTDKAVKKLEEEIGKEKAKDASEIIFKLSMAAFLSDAKLHNKSLDEVVSFLEDRKLRPRIIKAVEEGIIEGLRKGACLQEGCQR